MKWREKQPPSSEENERRMKQTTALGAFMLAALLIWGFINGNI